MRRKSNTAKIEVPEIKTMKFAFNKNKDKIFDKLICWWTSGPYSHVEAILDEHPDGTYTIASSVPGVGMRIATNQSLPSEHWDIIEYPGDLAKATKWFYEHDGEPYDYMGLLGFVFGPFVKQSSKKFFCSEACLASIGFNHPWRYDPNSMYDIMKYTFK